MAITSAVEKNKTLLRVGVHFEYGDCRYICHTITYTSQMLAECRFHYHVMTTSYTYSHRLSYTSIVFNIVNLSFWVFTSCQITKECLIVIKNVSQKNDCVLKY